MNLDELSSGSYGVLLLLTVSVCAVLAFPLVDAIKRHLDYWRTFKAQERRVR